MKEKKYYRLVGRGKKLFEYVEEFEDETGIYLDIDGKKGYDDREKFIVWLKERDPNFFQDFFDENVKPRKRNIQLGLLVSMGEFERAGELANTSETRSLTKKEETQLNRFLDWLAIHPKIQKMLSKEQGDIFKKT